jgi:predicted transcriptional regulator
MANKMKVVLPGDPILQDPERYATWFDEQVEAGLREADDPNTVMVPNEEVMRELDERLKKWNSVG